MDACKTYCAPTVYTAVLTVDSKHVEDINKLGLKILM